MKLLNTKDLDQFNIEGGYHKGGECDYTQLYPDAVKRIADARQVDEKDILLLDCWHEGEICVYISGKWSGYVSEWEKDDEWRRYIQSCHQC